MAEPDLVDRVRRRLAVGDPAARSAELAALVRAEAAVLADDAVLAELSRDVAAELSGAGPLEPLLALPDVTDVLVNGPGEVWLDRGRGLERAGVRFPDDAAVRRLAQRLAGVGGRRLDDAAPFVDACLPDGTRLHAVLPPITEQTTVSLRVLARRKFDLDALVPTQVAGLLRALVAARVAFLISGGTGSGKTTLLASMLSCASPDERLVLIEDARELVVDHPHVVRLVSRMPNVEGAGAVGLRELVRQALRMRPDRLVVGEFRGAEITELLVALNTGHEGGAATLHANSAADVPARLAALGALGGLTRSALTSQVAGAVDAVVHLRRAPDGSRTVDELGVLELVGDSLRVVPAWSAELGPAPGAATLGRLLVSRGVEPPAVLRSAGVAPR